MWVPLVCVALAAWTHVKADIVCNVRYDYIPDPDDCRAFYRCDDYEVSRQYRCDQGLGFNPKSRFCDDPRKIPECHLQMSQTGRCTSHSGRVPDPDDCRKFYSCVNGIAIHESCAEGTAFEPITRRCDFSFKVPRCRVATPSSSAVTTPCPGEGGRCSDLPTRIPADPGQNDGCAPYQSFKRDVSEDDKADPRCPKPDGIFKNPDNNQHYFVCLGGKLTEKICITNLVFDDREKRCDWAFLQRGPHRSSPVSIG